MANNIYFLELDSSFWKPIILTKKTIKFIRIKDKSNESLECDIFEIQCKFDNKSKHCIRDWEDGTYTIYPNRSGTPHYFRPATKKDVRLEIKDCKKWGVNYLFYEKLLAEIGV